MDLNQSPANYELAALPDELYWLAAGTFLGVPAADYLHNVIDKFRHDWIRYLLS